MIAVMAVGVCADINTLLSRAIRKWRMRCAEYIARAVARRKGVSPRAAGAATLRASGPKWRNGRRDGLKIRPREDRRGLTGLVGAKFGI
jgi:hypothetical protein